jgi:hypothetical protein
MDATLPLTIRRGGEPDQTYASSTDIAHLNSYRGQNHLGRHRPIDPANRKQHPHHNQNRWIEDHVPPPKPKQNSSDKADCDYHDITPHSPSVGSGSLQIVNIKAMFRLIFDAIRRSAGAVLDLGRGRTKTAYFWSMAR